MYRRSDSAATLISEVAAELGQDPQKWLASLSANLFTDCGSLIDLSSEDWMALNIPLRVLVECRKKIQNGDSSDNSQQSKGNAPALPSTAPPLVSNRPTPPGKDSSGGRRPPPPRRHVPILGTVPQAGAGTIDKSTLPPPPVPSRTSSGSFRDLPDMDATPPASSGTPSHRRVGSLIEDEDQGRGRSASFEDLKQFLAKDSTPSGKNRKDVHSIKRKLGSGKQSKITKGASIEDGIRINIVGREGNSKELIELALGKDCKFSSLIECYYEGKYQVYNHDVKVQMYDCASAPGVGVNLLVIVFHLHNLRSLVKMQDKYISTVSSGGPVSLPILLVGLDIQCEPGSLRKVSRLTALEFAEEMQALRYIEVKDADSAQEVFRECARVLVRDISVDLSPKFVDVISKISRTHEKKQTDLNLRKKQLPVLPNAIFILSDVITRLRLDGNQLQHFPVEVLEFRNLLELSLSGNNIKIIPDRIDRMKSLQKLDVENNALDTLPIDSIKRLHMLSELKIKNNPLSDLPPSFNLKSDILTQIRALGDAPPTPEPSTVPEVQLKPFKVFTVPLSELMSNEYFICPVPVPRIVRFAFQHIVATGLNQEGIWRIAGQNSRMLEIRSQIDSDLSFSFSNGESPHNITNILKQWLRELPEPILLFQNYDAILGLDGLSGDELNTRFNSILDTLPMENYHIIRAIFRLMYLSASNVEVNRMDFGNVAKVVGPNLIYSKTQEANPMASLSSVNTLNDVFTAVTMNYPSIFEENYDFFAQDYVQGKNDPYAVLSRKYFGHQKSVVAIVLDSTSTRVWTGDSKGCLRVWSASDSTLLAKYEVEGKRINCICRAGNNIWIGLNDRLQVRDEESGEVVTEFLNAPTNVMCVVKSSDGLLTQVWVGDNGKILIYDSEALEFESIPVNTLAIYLTETNESVWGVCVDRKIRVWHKQTRELLGEMDAQLEASNITSMSFVNNCIWTGTNNGNIYVWDVDTREVKAKLETKHEGKVFGMASVQEKVWTYAWDGSIHVYHGSAPYAHLHFLPKYHEDSIGGVVSIPVNDEHSKVFTASWDKSVATWLVRHRTLFSSR